MKTGVLIHGFHLQAKNWLEVVWGKPPDLLGRIPKGVLVAIKEKAEIIFLAGGASEINGKKEAEYTRDYLLERFFELAEFSAFRGINLWKYESAITRAIKVELGTQNTFQEIELAEKTFKQAGIERAILVSSPAHISRCLRDALMVLTVKDITAMPSQVSRVDPSEVIIIEPIHRPDKQKSGLHDFVKKLMKMPPAELEELIKKALA